MSDERVVAPALFPLGGHVGVDDTQTLCKEDAIVVAFLCSDGETEIFIPFYMPIDGAQALVNDLNNTLSQYEENAK